jgi:outer membrane protein assembly factor BamD
MVTALKPLSRRLIALSVVLCAIAVTACVTPVRMPAAGEREPDKYLFDRGTESLEKRRWLDAREYFQRLIDQFPQSPYRQEARLGVADSYLGQGGFDTLILAAERFREFLRFYPLNERADYAQYRLALAEFRQMLAPERDQTYTVNALKELAAFVERFPNSQYLPEVLKIQRQARDRLSESELIVGVHYFRNRWYPGAITRLENLISADPAFLHRDSAYYHLGESYYRTGRPKLALPYFDKLIEEFQVSEYLERARMRSSEIKAAAEVQGPAEVKNAADPAPAPAPPAVPAPAPATTR